MHSNLVSDLMLPFWQISYEVGVVVGVLVVLLAIVGSSNAVNLTDGLDGLAIGCTLIVSFVFLIFTYLAGNSRQRVFADSFRERRGRANRFLRAMIGAGLAFCGSTAIRRRCSWATRVRSRLAARSASSRC